jgi:hypothetical protein
LLGVSSPPVVPAGITVVSITGVFILKAKTRLENTYHLLSDDEDESKITPSDEKLSIPINIITSSSDIEFNCTNITANSVYQLTITLL